MGILYAFIALFFGVDLINLRDSQSREKIIEYTILEKRILTSGRGQSNEIDYSYDTKRGTVNITSREYDLISKGINPELFYSTETNRIYTAWEKKRALRIFVLFVVLSIITLIPWQKMRWNNRKSIEKS